MAQSLAIGLTRGLLLGLVGGLLAGLIEAGGLLRDSPVMRAALAEAALYTLIVDGLACAFLGGLTGAAFAAGLRIANAPYSSRTVAALYVSGAGGLVVAAAGLLWAFRAYGADRTVGVPTPIIGFILLLAVAVGTLGYPLAWSFAWSLLGSAKRTAIASVSGVVVLGLILPGQVVLEARQHAQTQRSDTLGNVDAALLATDLSAYLEDGIELAMSRAQLNRGSAGPPNVLLITVDALRADHISPCGNSWISTPSLELLARYSAVSCHTYTVQPQTNPALASIFTSTYPAINGVRVHMVDRLSESFDTVAKMLQRSGYKTAAIIPWTSLEPAFSGFQQGFETYEAFVLNEPASLQNPATASLAGLYRRVTEQVALGSAVESVLGLRQGTEAEIDGRADVTATAAINWLANNANSHFFLWVHYFDPHYPWTAPEPWDQLYEGGRDYDGPYDGGMSFVYQMRAGIFDPAPRDVEFLRAMYASEVSYTDRYIGQLLGYMAQNHLLENTIIVLTSDHGEQLGERGGPWPEGDFWLHGDDLYDEGIRVPFMVFDPRTIRDRVEVTAPVQHIDIVPTVLDLVGIPVPRQVMGRSIMPL
ncbi:MAG: hypothetical protein HW416_996, partial [Chloroflexi bacterium]|nr:hypothetical protein [Chloroflexota bacterium]